MENRSRFWYLISGMIILLQLATITNSNATSYVWNGSSNTLWSNNLNWTPNGVPGINDNVTISTSAPNRTVLDITDTVINITLNAGSNLDLNGFDLRTTGVTTMNTGSMIDLNNGSMIIAGTATLTAGTVNNSGLSGYFITQGTTTTFGGGATGPTFNAAVSVNSATVTMRATTFNAALNIIKTGATNDQCYGGNTFSGTCTFENAGTGYLLFSNNTKDIFNAPVTFTNTGTSLIYVAYNDVSGTQFNDNILVNSTSGSGVSFSASAGRSTLASGKTISVGGTGFTVGTLALRNFTQTGSTAQNITLTGTATLTMSSGTTINGDFTSSSPALLLNGSTYNGTATFTKTGTTNDSGTGNNTFNGATSLNASGSGQLILSNSTRDIFNNTLTITNTGTNTIYIANNDVTGTQFNANVYINATSGTGISFGNGSGSILLASGVTISVGGLGFSSGNLVLRRVIQTGNTDQNFTFTGTAGVNFGIGSIFNGNIVSSSAVLLLNGTTFNGTADLTKTGTTSDQGNGGNTFVGTATITNSGSGYLLTGNSGADVFNSDVTFNNSGTSSIYVAHVGAGTIFNSTVTFNNIGTGAANNIYICEGVAASSATFNGVVTANNLGTATSALIRFHCKGTCTFNEDIIVNSTSGTSASHGVHFGNTGNTGTGSLALGKTVTIGASGFSKGCLNFCRFTYNTTTPLTYTFTGTAGIAFGPATSFPCDVTTTSATLLLNGCTFGGTATLTKTGSVNDAGSGGNIFQGTTVITNSGSGYLSTGGTTGDTFNGDLTVNNTGTYYTYLANNSAGNVFNGAVTLNNNGTGTDTRILICEGGVTARATFNGVVTANNISTSTNGMIRFSQLGNCTFNEDIIVNSTVGSLSYGILFSTTSGSGSTTLASGKTISIGAYGFTKGVLNLLRFTSLSASPISLPLTSTAGLTFGPGSSFAGDVTGTCATLLLNGCNFAGNCTLTKNGSTNDTGTGANTFGGTTIINNSGTGYTVLGNANADTFNGDVTFNNNGTSSLYVAHNSPGNIFNGSTIFNNTGAGTSTTIYICEGGVTSTATFNNTVDINNTGTATSGLIRFSNRGNTVFNDNIIVSSTTGTTGTGIYFGTGLTSGTTTLAAGKTITTGVSGFNRGALNLIKFTQTGSTAQALTFTGTACLYIGPSSVFDGNVTFSSPTLQLNGCIYGGISDFTKTGSVADVGTGGNTFTGICSITNNSSAALTLSNVNPDVFVSDVTFNNQGSSNIFVAHNGIGNTFGGTTTFNNTGSGVATGIYVCDNGATSTATFNGPVYANNTGTATNGIIRFHQRGTCTFNDNVEINSTNSASANYGIYFGSGTSTGTGSIASGKLITIGASGFTKGSLYFKGFTQNGTSAHTFILTGTSTLYYASSSTFGGNVTSSSPSLFLNGTTFNGTADLTKTGSTSDAGTGGNIFNAATTLTNNGSGYLMTGNGSRDQFNSTLICNNTGTNYTHLAYASANNIFGGNTTLNNNGSGTDVRITVCESTASSATFNAPLTINNTGTATDGLIRFSNVGTTTFNDDVVINSSMGAATNWGIGFGYPGAAGTCSLSSGKTITVGGTGFIKGTLSFTNFTQNGSTAQNLALTGTGVLTYGTGTTFNGNVTSTSPDVYFNGTTFNGNLAATKNGNSNNTSNGNNTFNGTAGIINNGTGTITLSNVTRDIYNNDVTYTNTSSGIITTAYNDATGTTFNGNIILNSTGTGSIRFGQNLGTATLATGKTISIGGLGFASGDVYFRKFTQTGSTAQTISLTSGTAAVYFQTLTTFNGTLNFAFPQVNLNGATFNGTTTIEKTGATINNSTGANTFNGTSTFRNSGSGAFVMANTTADVFNADANFIQTGSGALTPANTGVNNFSGNISTVGTTTAITFGSGTGTVNISGNAAQAINGSGTYPPVIRRMTMNNTSTGLTLNVPVTINVSLTMTSGRIITNSTNVLNIANGISSIGSASSISYVEGPLKKTGNQAFSFPVGKNGNYRPIAMTAPGATTDQLTAEYYQIDPTLTYNPASRDAGLNHVSSCEYWDFNRNTGSPSVTLTLSWDNNTSCGVTTLTDLRVARWDTGLLRWRDQGYASSTGTVTSGTVTASSGGTTFGVFTLGSSTTNNPLPINLISFDAQLKTDYVETKWVTASELNNDYFTVEKSKDGKNYETVGIVKGAGTSNQTNNYSYNDYQLLKGMTYYRLKQTDYDGNSISFSPVTINNENEVNNFMLFGIQPNPFSHSFRISFYNPEETNLTLELCSSTGVSMYRQDINAAAGKVEYTIDHLQKLASGFYILKILNNNSVLETKKVVKY